MINLKHIIAILLLLIICSDFSLIAAEKQDTLRNYKMKAVTVSSIRAVERQSPVAFSQMSKSQIDESYTTEDLPMLLNGLPSVYTYSQGGNGIGYSTLSIRGFDQRRISVMINGIPQNDPEDHNVYWIDFPDIAENLDEIQIQRGAGLINYGSAAIGGSINLTTSALSSEPRVKLYSGFGFQTFGARDGIPHNTTKNLIEFNTGLIQDQYAFTARLSRIRSFGYRDNSWADLNSYYLSTLRLDDNFTTQINVFGGPLDDGLVYNGLPKSYIKDKAKRLENLSYWEYNETGKEYSWGVARRPQAVEHFSQPHYEVLNEWKASENLTFNSSLFYYTGKGYFDFSGEGWTDKEDYRLTEEYGWYDAEDPRMPIIRAFVSNKQGGWIPKMTLISDYGITTMGAEIRIHRSEHWGRLLWAENLPEGYDPNFKAYYNEGERDIMSIFARQQKEIYKDLLMSVDLQFVRHSYVFTNEKHGGKFTTYNTINGGIVGNGDDLFNINYLFVNPRFGLNYNFDEYSNAYTSVAYTSREPRMKNFYEANDIGGNDPLFETQVDNNGNIFYDFESPFVKPESMLDIELGYTFRDMNYFVNVNAYWMDYFDELVKSGQLDLFGNPIDGNAPRTRHIGIELQGSVNIVNTERSKLKFEANLTYSNNEILNYDFITDRGAIVSLKGNKIAGFPDLMANARLAYQFDDFFCALSMRYIGKSKTDNFGDLLTTNENIIDHLLDPENWVYNYYTDNTLDAFTLFDLNASYRFRDILGSKSIRVQVQISNLLNELYAAGAEGKEFFPGAERHIYLGFALEF